MFFTTNEKRFLYDHTVGHMTMITFESSITKKLLHIYIVNVKTVFKYQHFF